MTTYEQGVLDEQNRIIALLDQYDIEELLGGGILLRPKIDNSWKGKQHKTGSLSSYIRGGCRCDACKAFISAYNKERKARKVLA
jgi:hypothetical protein